MIDVFGKPMISRVISNVVPRGENNIVVACSPEMPQIYDVKRVVIPEVTDGAARTAIIALHTAQVPLDEPLMIANSDQLLDWDPQDFINCMHGYDGGIVVFHEPAQHPKWSYAHIKHRLVMRVAEKQAISEWATAGIYYWARTEDFLRSATEMIALDERTNGEFYIAPSFNYLIRERKRIIEYPINGVQMHGLGDPEALQKYLAIGKVKM